MAQPIFFATIIIITAYIPLFSFERVEYRLFSPMAYAVGFSLFGALLVALALIPGLAYEAYRRPGRVFHNRVIESLTTRYTALLRGLLARHVIAPSVLAVSLCAVAVLGLHIGKDFLPELDEGSIWLQATLPPGISLETAKGLANEVRKAAGEFPEVSHVVTQLGRNDEGTDPWTPSHIEASVGLHPYKTWKSGITKHELIGRMKERFSQIPGIVVGFSQPMIDGVNDKIAGAHSDLVIKVFGEDFGEARRISEKIMATIASVPGAADVAIDQEPPLPQVQITLDRQAAARYGINAADVAGLIASGIGGQPISQLFVGEKRYDVVVRFTGAAREDPDAIGNLVLTAPTGARVPLSQVATVSLRSGESTITREMGRRHLTVKLNLRGRDLSAFLEEAKGRIEREVKYDPGAFEIVWGGQFENQQRAEARLSFIMPITLAIMFVLLFSQFRNLRNPILILVSVPLAALGGLLALGLRGMTLNVSSAVGFIALFGVAVQNGIIMVSNLNRLAREGGNLREAVVNGATERFRPVIMTASVAMLGLLPAALATGLGSDVQRPLATVVVGGLITATVLTLLLLPALYFLVETWHTKRTSATRKFPDGPVSEAQP